MSENYYRRIWDVIPAPDLILWFLPVITVPDAANIMGQVASSIGTGLQPVLPLRTAGAPSSRHLCEKLIYKTNLVSIIVFKTDWPKNVLSDRTNLPMSCKGSIRIRDSNRLEQIKRSDSLFVDVCPFWQKHLRVSAVPQPHPAAKLTSLA